MNGLPNAGRIQPPVILVVGADPAMRRLLILHLQITIHQAEYLEAGDVQTTLQVAHERQPSLILLDGQLPIASGAEVARRLRREARLSAIPIIALTTTPRFGALLRQLKKHCTWVFRKPGQLKLLRSTVQSIVVPPLAAPPAAGSRPYGPIV